MCFSIHLENYSLLTIHYSLLTATLVAHLVEMEEVAKPRREKGPLDLFLFPPFRLLNLYSKKHKTTPNGMVLSFFGGDGGSRTLVQ